MKKISSYLRDGVVTTLLLLLAFAASLLCHKLDVEEHTTTVFVFAVFLISLVTNGYLYGLLAAASTPNEWIPCSPGTLPRSIPWRTDRRKTQASVFRCAPPSSKPTGAASKLVNYLFSE